MYGILAIGILVFVGILALLTWWNEKTMARALAPYLASTRAERPELPALPMTFYGGPVGAVGHSTASTGHSMRQYRTEAALAPVQWHDNGELLPALPEPPTIRIGGRPEPEQPTTAENWTPARTPALESDFLVPGAQAVATALAAGICAGLLAWALGWSWRVPVAVLGLALAGGWFWRLGIADSLLWQLETWSGRDLDNDNHVGRPQVSFTLANPATARQAVAKETRQAAQTEAQAELLAFVDRCFMAGTAEGKHGVKAAGPDRTIYLAKRDVLLSLGVARWKNPERPRAGWELACSRQRARQVVSKHVL